MNAPDKCPGCGSPAAVRKLNNTEYECIARVFKSGEFMPSVPCVAIQRDQLAARVKELEEALRECDAAFSKFCPDENSSYGMAWDSVKAALTKAKETNP